MTAEEDTVALSLPSEVQARMIEVMRGKTTPLKVTFSLYSGNEVTVVAHDPEYIDVKKSDYRTFSYHGIKEIKLAKD